MSKEKWFLLIVISLLSGIVIAFMYINPYEEMTLSGIICQISGSSGPFQLGYSFTELTGFALRMIPTYVFEGCFGIYLYHRFCTASVYIFSRYTKRVRWYLKESFFLGVYAASFQSVLVGSAVVTTVLRYGEK